MKGFRKLSSIAVLLFAFVSPPSLAEAKDISLSNALSEQSVARDANLVGNQTGELLIAQRRSGRYQRIRRRQIMRRRQGFGRYQRIQRRQPYGRYQRIERRQPYGRYQRIERRQPYGRYENFRRRY
ncbi:hypothetical protein [Nostoc sp. 'Lobaria pulmonaria (5183) cyanobiont']|uniref:hypothetical protein n=1 Tax=Nostoc sp. 'Lobaria pulmonaria (5183) cyanobiont' TaxID=1618022 RepID=UPI001319FEB3|nr:hypothetical protein [Nostoc sp. 'Lobaria pulmonaria (5183) cyanobiont']